MTELKDIEGETAERVKRLGGAVLAIWDDIPDKLQTKLLAQCGKLRGGGSNILSEMRDFINAYSGEVE